MSINTVLKIYDPGKHLMYPFTSERHNYVIDVVLKNHD